MWKPPTKKQLEKIPKLYETEDIPLTDKKVYMHFFIGGCDWYAVEYSENKHEIDGEFYTEKIFFGFAILNNDTQNAEWGYFSLDELAGIKIDFVEVDRNQYWEVKKVKDIPKIMGCLCMQSYIEKQEEAERLIEIHCKHCNDSYSLPVSYNDEPDKQEYVCSKCFKKVQTTENNIILLTQAC